MFSMMKLFAFGGRLDDPNREFGRGSIYYSGDHYRAAVEVRPPLAQSTLSLQKSEGSRAKATKGEAVVNYCESLATRDLES
jgi:hypothetical protein